MDHGPGLAPLGRAESALAKCAIGQREDEREGDSDNPFGKCMESHSIDFIPELQVNGFTINRLMVTLIYFCLCPILLKPGPGVNPQLVNSRHSGHEDHLLHTHPLAAVGFLICIRPYSAPSADQTCAAKSGRLSPGARRSKIGRASGWQ